MIYILPYQTNQDLKEAHAFADSFENCIVEQTIYDSETGEKDTLGDEIHISIIL